MSLALSTLLYEWRRYMAAVIALAFSGLLVLAQVGMFTGMGKSFTATIERSPADLMVLGARAENMFNGGAGLPRRVMPQVSMHPEVAALRDADIDGGMWSNVGAEGKRKREYVNVMVVDPYPGSVTLPIDYPEHVRQALLEPFAVVMDKTALPRLGVKVGDKATFNGKVVKVRATLEGYPNMMGAQIVMSRDTLRLVSTSTDTQRVGPLMVRLTDPSRAEIVRDQLNASAKATGQDKVYRVWTRDELSNANEKAFMKESVIAIMLGFSVFLGFLIGVGITSQTLRGAVLASIKEFASLRALGVSMGSLRKVVMELSFWIGVAGLAATAVLTGAVALLANSTGVPMAFPLETVLMVSALLVFIAMASGFLSLGVLKKSQPADLLR